MAGDPGPRRYLRDPGDFGREGAGWVPRAGTDNPLDVALAWYQHQVIGSLNRKLQSGEVTLQGLNGALGTENFGRKISGANWIRLVDLLAIAMLAGPEALPAWSLDARELFPPAYRPYLTSWRGGSLPAWNTDADWVVLVGQALDALRSGTGGNDRLLTSGGLRQEFANLTAARFGPETVFAAQALGETEVDVVVDGQERVAVCVALGLNAECLTIPGTDRVVDRCRDAITRAAAASSETSSRAVLALQADAHAIVCRRLALPAGSETVRMDGAPPLWLDVDVRLLSTESDGEWVVLALAAEKSGLGT